MGHDTIDAVIKKSPAETAKRRIFELDLLRGFFIFVIIIDHLQFWPSPLGFLTGEGRLWVTAAEGFFLISGLLIGYIRAYKGQKHSMKDLTIILWKRAVMLYVWGAGVTFAVVGFTLAIGGHQLLPATPSGDALSSPFALISAVLSGDYFNSWIYFLRLYAIMLLVTPLFLWLLRKKQDLLVVALILGLYLASFWLPEAALQWQVLFFGAALIGYRFESIISFFRARPLAKQLLTIGTIGFTAITISISGFFTLGWELIETPGFFMSRDTYEGIRIWLDPWFSNNPMQPTRIALAFIWFTAGLLFLNLLKPFIMRWLGWLLLPFGERSLTGYILQALILPFIVVTVPVSEHSIVNGLVGAVSVLLIWWLMQTKLISRIVPR